MSNESTSTLSNYSRLFEQVQDYAIIMMDPEGDIQDWNQGAQHIKGYKPEEIVGLNFRLFYTEEDRKQKKPDRLLKIARQQGRANDEGWRVRKDGSRFWASVTITAIYDNEGELMGFGKVTRDLTERRAAEISLQAKARQLKIKNDELRKSEMRFRHMMEEVQDYAILLMDKEGYILNWNQGAEKIKGYKAKEIIGGNFRKFYPAKDRENGKPDRLLSLAKNTGRAQDEGFRVRKDGSTFWGSITITAIHDDEGKLIGFSKVTRDLTERKAAEDALGKYARELEVKNKELEQFATLASHDLQEPLYTINTFVRILQKHSKDLDEDSVEYLELISDAANRMREFVKDLLEYSRLGTNRKLTSIDCNVLLQNLKNDLSATISETGARIESPQLPVITGYKSELRLLFQNLLSNGIKFRKAGIEPVITISHELKDGCHQFAVSDNGIGIADEDQDKIFQIFRQLHPRKEYSGTGVGLAHCLKIVQMHGGQISVKSEEGIGSTFYFSIPEKPMAMADNCQA